MGGSPQTWVGRFCTGAAASGSGPGGPDCLSRQINNEGLMSTQNKALRRFVEEEMKISANELEYLAEYVEIEIVPRFQFNTIKLLQKCNNASGEYGPFLPLRPVIVPLWLALQLKQQRLCSISAPSWMSIAKLEETLENERQSREKNLLTEGILLSLSDT